MADPRPFYHRFAWAYDLFANEPIGARIAAIVALLNKRGVRPGERVLDAGCGTGRYASELASQGFRVLGVDSSAEMVEVARKQSHAASANLEFSVSDLTSFKRPGQFGAILCRGVLNDLLTDDDREKIAHRFAEIVAPDGVLLLDVRDWLKTVDRYRDRTETVRSIELADRSHLTFQSETTLEPSTRQMIVSETFQFCGAGLTIEQCTTEFRMRCWSASELQECFGLWFLDMDILPDYVVPPAWTDRLVLVAKRKRDG
jgi:SAM-dependent methyltransferase